LIDDVHCVHKGEVLRSLNTNGEKEGMQQKKVGSSGGRDIRDSARKIGSSEGLGPLKRLGTEHPALYQQISRGEKKSRPEVQARRDGEETNRKMLLLL